MHKAFHRASFSLAAIAALILLFAGSALARDWGRYGDGQHIVGMDVKAEHGGKVGKVVDLIHSPDGSVSAVVVGLDGTDRAVEVPVSSVILHHHRGLVEFKGSRDDLYAMAPAERWRGYYSDRYGNRYNDRGRWEP